MALMALGRHDDVLAEMRATLELDPENPLAHLLKGEALFYKGEHAQAAEVLSRARSLDPIGEEADKLLAEIRSVRTQAAGLAHVIESTDTKEYPASKARTELATRPEALGLSALQARADQPGAAPAAPFAEVEETLIDPDP